MKSIMQYWNEWIQSIAESNDQGFQDTISGLNETIQAQIIKIKELEKSISFAKNEITNYVNDAILNRNKIETLTKQLEELMIKQASKESELEKYWNSKIKPTTKVMYTARDGKSMNVLRFFKENNDNVRKERSGSNDIKANNCLKWVVFNVKYTSDKVTSGRSEQWQWANETVETKKGDCEDGAILMANMMIASGIPYWRVRLNAGSVKGGGHAYVTYLRESDNKWYVMDWCYWPNESLGFKKTWADAKKYFGIWFSWNIKYGFIKDTLDRE